MKGALLLLCLTIPVHGAEQSRLNLEHADRAEGSGTREKRLIGNVRFVQDEAVLECDSARHNADQQSAVLQGRVRFHKGIQRLYSEQLLYFEDTRRALAEGNVKLIDSTKVLLADRLDLYDPERRAIADGAVVLLDTLEYLRITGEHAEYDQDRAYARVTIEPRFTKLDSIGSVDLTITGTIMEMFEDGDKIRITGDVVITRGETLARCDSVHFFREDQRVELFPNPIAWQRDDILLGERMTLLLDGSDLKGIHIRGSSLVRSKIDSAGAIDPPFDLLTGEEITVSLREERIDTVKVRGRATSYYHVIEDGEEKGLNKVLGDRIDLFFSEGELQKVLVRSDPEPSEGIFYPPQDQDQIEGELREELARVPREAGE